MPEVVAGDGEHTEAVGRVGHHDPDDHPQRADPAAPLAPRGRPRAAPVAALAAAAWGVWTYLVPHHATVPRVTGAVVADAKSQLIRQGFAVDIGKAQYYDGSPPITCCGCRPPAGTVLKRGDTVTLIASLGPPPVPVPSVVGQDAWRTPRSCCTNAHLTLGAQTSRYDPIVAKGDVLSQSPSDGTAPKGSAVDLVISKGPPRSPIPDVTGKTLAAATEPAHPAGFTVTVDPRLQRERDARAASSRARPTSASPPRTARR